MQTVNQIRNSFLDFFGRSDHEIVRSSPLVPHNDPTLMFTNAGMVQFKDVFTAKETRNYNRAATSQKCVRAGGKHNDLDNVGYTARHHTFFEMLGNFSFGDYFKEDAIKFAWDFLTREIDLPRDKLYVTVYHTDDEAFNLWKKIAGLADNRIIRIATSDNFWAMGDTGPCGPCSEIFFDHGENIYGGLPGSADEDGDRYIEIWNLVFMQYEQVTKEERISLPKPSIDTGMGLERISAVLQGVHDNYDIDLFQKLIAASKQISRNNEMEISHRVIADHLRSTSFLIADGVMPSNEGRGYVLRRIMRRAMRHANHLGARDPMIFHLVPALIAEMGEAYPELKRAEALITETIRLEEERFLNTLDRGLKLLDQEVANIAKGGVFKGDIAFKLYDTYGFPLDLTKDILRNRDISVDDAGFDSAMKEQKERAKAAWTGSGESKTDSIWFEIKEEFGATEFLGYELEQAQGKVLAIIKDSAKLTEISVGKVAIITNQTPFYGESGGQAGDCGWLIVENGEAEIIDTKKYLGDLHIHIAEIKKGVIKLGDAVMLKIDATKRLNIRANHSATHILHKILRDILGEHVTQKGSLVAANYLRFDFSHNKALSKEEVSRIEMIVNYHIRSNSLVGTKLSTPDEAIKAGAMALFGEKYGDEVRVVAMESSVELCGGTHVERTGDIGLFKIISESAIASGIRRIEAVTGEKAIEYIINRDNILAELALQFKVQAEEIPTKIDLLQEERKRLEKELSKAQKQAAYTNISEEEVGGVKFIHAIFDDLPAKEMRELAEEIRAKGVLLFISQEGGKLAIITAVAGELTDRYNAAELIKPAIETTGGKGGGGRPEFAQGGGVDSDKAKNAIEEVKKLLQEK